jgi:hypothetical protein
MHRLMTGVVVITLSAGACLAEPDDVIARALSEVNLPSCDPLPSWKPHVAEWRHDIATDMGEKLTLWGFPCDSGGYNTIWSVVLWSEREGHRIVSLPVPLYSPAEGGDRFTVTGMVADTLVWGASFDPESGLLRSARSFRASYDAATIGHWRLMPDQRRFKLVRYEADRDMDSVLDLRLVVQFD